MNIVNGSAVGADFTISVVTCVTFILLTSNSANLQLMLLMTVLYKNKKNKQNC